MSIKIAPLSSAEALKTINLREDHFGDVKGIDVSPSKLTTHISAFANAEGGEIYIGIDEDTKTKMRSWRGFARLEDANNQIAVFDRLFPLGEYFQYSFLSARRLPGYVLQISISKTPDIKYASDKTAYIRRNAQTLAVSTVEAMERLRLDKGIQSFESETVACGKEVVTAAETLRQFMAHVVPTAKPPAWLKKVQLLRRGKPVVAAVVLFSDDPQSVLPKHCSVKISRYKTKDEEGERETLDGFPTTVEGPLYDQIYEAVNATKQMIEGIKKLGPGGFEAVEYPDETLHEIITNAVLHRDYSLADDVHVRIFDNRVEVESPGRLPGHVTVENILKQRSVRNGSIVRWINRFPNPPNKDVGEGLNTAFSAMSKLRLREPEIEQRPHSVIVYIRHESLASPETTVIEYLRANPGAQVNNAKVRDLCHVRQDWVARKVLKDLERAKEIGRVPGTRTAGTAYRLRQKRRPKNDVT